MRLILEDNQVAGLVKDKIIASDSDLSAEDLLIQASEAENRCVRYGYHTSGMKYLVPEGSVSELLHNSKIYHLPNAPKWICGLINMHGNVIPVVDVASISGDEISHISKSNILVIKNKDIAVGVLIDGYPEAITEDEYVEQVNGVPEGFQNYSKAGICSNGKLWAELDIYGLLRELALLNAGNNNYC